MIEHHLAVRPQARPVKQKVRKQAVERQEFIAEEIKKLEAAGLVRGVLHPTWLANPVVVRKANGKWRICIDFTDVNKDCPKDPFPLPRIDQIVDSTAGCDLLSFLDAYSGYHQIFMAEEDEEKTAFITPCGTYYFIRMPFGLKNAGSTFARVIHTAFEPQIHRNVEAYMDDIVVKSRNRATLIQDLEKTFANLAQDQLQAQPREVRVWSPFRQASRVLRVSAGNRSQSRQDQGHRADRSTNTRQGCTKTCRLRGGSQQVYF